MMLYPAMRDLLKKVPSRYQLVNVVASRAREIASEAEMAGEPLDDKPVSIAIQEVADGKLRISQPQTQKGERAGAMDPSAPLFRPFLSLQGGRKHGVRGGQGRRIQGGLRH